MKLTGLSLAANGNDYRFQERIRDKTLKLDGQLDGMRFMKETVSM
jgi:hypothetical protein